MTDSLSRDVSILDRDTLRIERFCGHHVHPVESVEVWIDRPSEEGEPLLLNLEFHCGVATEEDVPERESLGTFRPTVEVWIPVPGLDAATLDGFRTHIPWEYWEERDALNRFYVFEHESWNSIDVDVSVDGDRVRVLCRGVARDPNHYDGSMPQARLSVDASFPLPSG